MIKKINMGFIISLLFLCLVGCSKIVEKDSTEININEDNITINGEGCTSESSSIQISDGGVYTVTGNSSEIAIFVDTNEAVVIELNGVDLCNPTGPVIYGNNSNSITIVLADGTENILTDGGEYDVDEEGNSIGKGVIFSNNSLFFEGDGALIINANYKHGIVSEDSITFESGDYNIISSGTDGIHASELLTVNGGNFDITSASDLMESEQQLLINGGSIIGESEDEGLEAKDAIIINDGYIDISVEDDGLNATNLIEINGGTIYITARVGDAVDCNGADEGSITINGGFLYAMGGAAPEGGLDTDNSSVVINGGTVIATGAVNSPISENSDQTTVVYGAFEADTCLGILDKDGNTLFAINPTISGSTMIISVEGLNVGEEYDVYSGGSISGEADEYGFYKDGTYSEGESVYSFTVESSVVQAGGSAEGMQGMQGGGSFGGNRPDGNSQPGEAPEGFEPGEAPEDFEPGEMPEGSEPPANGNARGDMKPPTTENGTSTN